MYIYIYIPIHRLHSESQTPLSGLHVAALPRWKLLVQKRYPRPRLLTRKVGPSQIRFPNSPSHNGRHMAGCPLCHNWEYPGPEKSYVLKWMIWTKPSYCLKFRQYLTTHIVYTTMVPLF